MADLVRDHDIVLTDSDYYTANEVDDSIPSSDSSDEETVREPNRLTGHIPIQPQPTEMPSRGGSKPRMCVVCGVRPQYNNGVKSYPTCGLSCAAKLDRSRSGKGSGSDNLCVVCHTRPKYSRGGKSYPTCGLTCAAKLNPPNPRGGTAEITVIKDPNSSTATNFTRNAGGRAETERARHARAPATTIVAIIQVLQCRFRETTPRVLCAGRRRGGGAPIFAGAAVLMRPNTARRCSWKLPADILRSKRNSWKSGGTPCPEVKKVYKIVQRPMYATNYKTYQHLPIVRSRVGNELRRWHGTKRECTIGNGGNATPCTSRTCSLCYILRSTVDAAQYPGGLIHSSSTSDKSDQYSDSPNQYPSKAMLLTKVAAGKSAQLSRSQLSQGVPAGYNSVGTRFR
ncbi:predicted protein [Postia placenta Mad-698-R]|uniref:Uncharacterized protein n=1 Tax=Postia placenta MAD-698-R-SB12 TaxID=670580 RepID=A0A1X6MUW1_9APHY|nr:hypothetical protein POSPLADRAFT_1048472 [Postia placenta MAD-698-R-SB12]EED81023.1 predicted protein [Postia placenta Mad-698-R]OSX60040.1 hypothetical protein POSPLADRAFT_1048472 [Postia placenta MAD-698-R-SB12]